MIARRGSLLFTGAPGVHASLMRVSSAPSKALGIQSSVKGMHVGAMLGDETLEDRAADLALPSGWHPNLRVILSTAASPTGRPTGPTTRSCG